MSVIPTELDFDRSVRAYVKAATALAFVVPGNANAPSPTVPYASVLLLEDSGDGFAWNKKTYNDINENFEYNTYDSRQLIYSIQIYRATNANGIARGLASYHTTPNGQYELVKNGLVVTNFGDVSNTDLLTDGQFERRSTLELTFGLISVQQQVVEELIESEIDIDSSDGENDINDTIIVTD